MSFHSLAKKKPFSKKILAVLMAAMMSVSALSATAAMPEGETPSNEVTKPVEITTTSQSLNGDGTVGIMPISEQLDGSSSDGGENAGAEGIVPISEPISDPSDPSSDGSENNADADGTVPGTPESNDASPENNDDENSSGSIFDNDNLNLDSDIQNDDENPGSTVVDPNAPGSDAADPNAADPNADANQDIQVIGPVTAINGATIDPSDLSSWLVYDHYYSEDPNWTSAGAPNWDSTRNNGYHPYYYWKEQYSHLNPVFFDLENATDIQRMQVEVFGPNAATYPTYNTPVLANFSRHIYTEGDANNAKITFLGYGSTFKTDFAIAPVTQSGLKSISFDLDWSLVHPHTLDSFGFLINASVDKDTDILHGYVINFQMNNNNSKNKSGKIQLIDFSGGVSASKLHNGQAGHERLRSKGQVTYLGDFNLDDSSVGKAHFDLDVEPTNVSISLQYMGGVDPTTTTQNFSSKLTDTGYGGFGPIVNYSGQGHTCARLSSVSYSNLKMAENYSVIFDGNGADIEAIPNRINDVQPGNSLSAQGLSLPTDPQRTGYKFMGWNTSADGTGTSFDATTPVSQIITVYAQWNTVITSATVNYATEGNGFLNGNTTETVNIGSSPVAVPTPVPSEGYEFKHWRDNSGNVYATTNDVLSMIIQGDITLTAVFEAKQISDYTITFYPGKYGTFTGETSFDIKAGDPIGKIPTVVPDATIDASFDYWIDCQGNIYSTDQELMDAVPSGSLNVIGVFHRPN